jgi:AcrR family transcriptional regulator
MLPASLMNRSSRPPPLSLRERNKRKTLATIRQAAWSLFVEKGFERTTTREIAERAKVAAGTVFVHAKDKDELLAMVFQQRVSTAFERGFDAVDESAALTDRLVSVFGVFFDEYALQPELALRFLCVTLTLSGAHGQTQAQVEEDFVARLAAVLSRARDKGETRDDLDCVGYARNLFALYRFAVFRWLASEHKRDASQGKSTLRESFAVAHTGARPRAKKRATIAPDAEVIADERRSLRVSATPSKGHERASVKGFGAPRVPADLLAGLGALKGSSERPPPDARPSRRPNR